MLRTKKIFAAVFIGGACLGLLTDCKKEPSSKKTERIQWVMIDENYHPKDLVEDFIMRDAAQKDLLPVSIKNYGNNASVLKKFKGKRVVSPSKGELQLLFKGLEDWKLIDIRRTTEDEREVRRAVLYVKIDGNWQVGDSGSIFE
ncbi:MAG: hypothetical protein JXB26_08665 [Candidatus Aminicenantes bacterium]|nr:hypothetical protein [Candidatus Aminicenantes bacterium]